MQPCPLTLSVGMVGKCCVYMDGAHTPTPACTEHTMENRDYSVAVKPQSIKNAIKDILVVLSIFSAHTHARFVYQQTHTYQFVSIMQHGTGHGLNACAVCRIFFIFMPNRTLVQILHLSTHSLSLLVFNMFHSNQYRSLRKNNQFR